MAEFISANGTWLWEKFESFLPMEVNHAIDRLRPMNSSGREDHPRWWCSTDGHLSVKSVYKLLCNRHVSTGNGLWRKIWKLPVPQRYMHFQWLCGRNRLLTNQDRFRRGLLNNDGCNLCNSTKEDLMHALRDCTIAARCWDHILPSQLRGRFLAIQEPRRWLEWNLSNGRVILGHPWRRWFAVVSRHIWLNRNAQVFQRSDVGFKQIIAQAHAVPLWDSGSRDKSQRSSITNAWFVATPLCWLYQDSCRRCNCSKHEGVGMCWDSSRSQW